MGVNELREQLLHSGIPADAWSLQGGTPNECFCITQNGKWEVYYSERGKKTGMREFNTESDACAYFWNEICRAFPQFVDREISNRFR